MLEEGPRGPLACVPTSPRSQRSEARLNVVGSFVGEADPSQAISNEEGNRLLRMLRRGTGSVVASSTAWTISRRFSMTSSHQSHVFVNSHANSGPKLNKSRGLERGVASP